MDLLVRPARPEDPCVPLLFESAKPYYTAYAGSERARAGAAASASSREPGHAASYELLPGRAWPTSEIVGRGGRLPGRATATGSRAGSSR